MLVIKTGMASEFSIVKKYAAPHVLVLTGVMTVDDLRKAVPANATAIMSCGMCGGLAPDIKVGDIVLASQMVMPGKNGFESYQADPVWNGKLWDVLGRTPIVVPWWSSGEWNTANTKAQRDLLFHQTGCHVIDDESYAVAQFAAERKISFTALRTASDAAVGPTANLPPAVIDALNSSGSVDIPAVIYSVVKDPWQIPALVDTAIAYAKCKEVLEQVCRKVSPDFGWLS